MPRANCARPAAWGLAGIGGRPVHLAATGHLLSVAKFLLSCRFRNPNINAPVRSTSRANWEFSATSPSARSFKAVCGAKPVHLGAPSRKPVRNRLRERAESLPHSAATSALETSGLRHLYFVLSGHSLLGPELLPTLRMACALADFMDQSITCPGFQPSLPYRKGATGAFHRQTPARIERFRDTFLSNWRDVERRGWGLPGSTRSVWRAIASGLVSVTNSFSR